MDGTVCNFRFYARICERAKQARRSCCRCIDRAGDAENQLGKIALSHCQMVCRSYPDELKKIDDKFKAKKTLTEAEEKTLQ